MARWSYGLCVKIFWFLSKKCQDLSLTQLIANNEICSCCWCAGAAGDLVWSKEFWKVSIVFSCGESISNGLLTQHFQTKTSGMSNRTGRSPLCIMREFSGRAGGQVFGMKMRFPNYLLCFRS